MTQRYTRPMGQHLFDLIRQGKTAEIADLVNAQPQAAHSRDAQGISALMLAVYTQQPVVRDFLLAHCGELDVFEAAAVGDCIRLQSLIARDAMQARAISPDGWTPLHLAAAFATAEAVTLLVEHGAHVHQVSHNPLRNQPLHACVSLNHSVATLSALLEAGADVNATQHGGFTPLMQAAAAGKREMAAILLRNGANPAARCDKGKTAIDYARERAHRDIVELLEKHRKQDQQPTIC